MFNVTFFKLFLISSLLLFSACGGGSSSTNTATENGEDTTDEQNSIQEGNENSNSTTTLTISAGADRTVQVNTPIMIIGEILGDKEEISSYEWKKSEEVLATTLKFEYIPTQVGIQQLTLKVLTNSGEQLQDTMSLEVREEYTMELLPF